MCPVWLLRLVDLITDFVLVGVKPQNHEQSFVDIFILVSVILSFKQGFVDLNAIVVYFSSISIVVGNMMPQLFQMNSDLMRPSSMRVALDQSRICFFIIRYSLEVCISILSDSFLIFRHFLQCLLRVIDIVFKSHAVNVVFTFVHFADFHLTFDPCKVDFPVFVF